ncbi:copper chaperone [Pseudoalteromonas phenolica]|uniref:Copper chaperone n=1 Tax=Pseudoalteromonas phenolica TaxID=161398 RepID=A0A5R9PWK9_9GAMM|nr:copper chaperone PCu(A)C [Pseudoalteromonas phenolica]TLX45298.1 copper chaperone [Pseudoalteromonas phenolica]
MLLRTLSLAAALLLSGLSQAHEGHSHDHSHVQKELMVTDAQIRTFLPAAKSTAAYFTIHNPMDKSVFLKKATIRGIGRVEIHEHVHKNGMMRMQRVESVELPANQQIVFQPGGFHLMAFEPEHKLKVGEKRKLTLYFDNGDRLYSFVEVVSLKDTFEKPKNSHHSHH